MKPPPTPKPPLLQASGLALSVGLAVSMVLWSYAAVTTLTQSMPTIVPIPPSPISPPPMAIASMSAVVGNGIPSLTPGPLSVIVVTETPRPIPTKTAAEKQMTRVAATATSEARALLPQPCPTNVAALKTGDFCLKPTATALPVPTSTPFLGCEYADEGAICEVGGTWKGETPTPAPNSGGYP